MNGVPVSSGQIPLDLMALSAYDGLLQEHAKTARAEKIKTSECLIMYNQNKSKINNLKVNHFKK